MCSSGAVIARKNCKSERIRTVTFKKQLLQEQRILALVVVQLQVPYVLAVTLPAIVSTPKKKVYERPILRRRDRVTTGRARLPRLRIREVRGVEKIYVEKTYSQFGGQ